ncbi:MAG: polysaccharide deacetylase [Anaerolineae bacterium]|jgi:peptidoglycan/xylan/chitin deacetylase (PgdA/CDA1 family)
MTQKPYTVCLTFDFDALSVWLGDDPHATPAMLSRGEYGARVGVPRILKLLAAYDLPATFFVPGHTAESFPTIVESILVAGHEVAHHGYGHQDPSSQSPAEERRSLERGMAVLERFLGGPPLGYRSPSWDYSPVTLSLLVEYGFTYDSSLFAGDFRPYHPRLGDRVGVEGPLVRGQEVDLWEFPVDFCLDDWPYFTFKFDPPRAGLSAPSKVLEIWGGEFDYMVEHEEGGVLTVTMHPQVIGRGHRMALLERFVQHVLSAGSARIACLGDVAGELSAAEDQ